MTQTYIVREDENERVNAENEAVKELVLGLDKAIQSGGMELLSILKV